jgi:hypothetical protein
VFNFLVIQWQTESPIAEFQLELDEEVNSADFYFVIIFSDNSDIRYIKGIMIENDKFVYDITMTQCNSIKVEESEMFPNTFLTLFNQGESIPSLDELDHFKHYGIEPPTSLPESLELYRRDFQVPAIDNIIKTGRSSLIESALKHKTENDSTFKGDHHFVNTVLLPLITSKRNELTEVVSIHFTGISVNSLLSASQESERLNSKDLQDFLEDQIRYFTDLDRVV